MKPLRTRRANLGQIIDRTGKPVRVWFEAGSIHLRRYRSRKTAKVTLDQVADIAIGQKLLPL